VVLGHIHYSLSISIDPISSLSYPEKVSPHALRYIIPALFTIFHFGVFGFDFAF
jgi:hypothetical protein